MIENSFLAARVWNGNPVRYSRNWTEYKFNLDPCAQSHNALCPKYFTPEDDGLHKIGRVTMRL